MRKLSLEEWERRYIRDEIKRFDQRYTMFSRPMWDPEIKDLLRWVLEKAELGVQPGRALQDKALELGSRVGVMMHFFENDRPNPSAVSREIGAILTPERIARNIMVSLPREGERMEITNPAKLTRDLKKAAIYFGADMVGVCKLEKRWIYSHSFDLGSGEYHPQEIPESFQYAVVMGYGEEYDMLKYSSTTYYPSAEASMGYSRMAITNASLSRFIKTLGYQAMSCSTNDVAITIPMAMQAGLGELGRHGLLITPQFGPAVRISKVLTDLPLISDNPIDFGVTEFCQVCEICADKCPGQAIPHGKQTTCAIDESNVPGALKWPVDAKKCISYWARNGKGCINCVSVCPFTKSNTLFHRFVKWMVDHVRWADALYVKGDKLLRYSELDRGVHFWDEWQPLATKSKRVKKNKTRKERNSHSEKRRQEDGTTL